jgi:hypothetical protein
MCFSNTKSKQRDRALRGSYAYLNSGVMAQEPAGLLYQPDFMSAAQERLLVADRAADHFGSAHARRHREAPRCPI